MHLPPNGPLLQEDYAGIVTPPPAGLKPPVRDGPKVLAMLKRALKVAGLAKEQVRGHTSRALCAIEAL